MKIVKVKIKDYQKGKMLGFADVAFSLDDSQTQHMEWRGFNIFSGENRRIEIGLPSKKDETGKINENTGNISYYPVITIQRAKNEEPKGVGDTFFERLREEIEKEYNNRSQDTQSQQGSYQPQKQTVSNQPSDSIEDGDVPF